jgi:NADH dehydrogenase
MEFYKITVYDVAPTVLPMFDENLSKYAMRHFAREGIQIKTSRRIEELRKGVPQCDNGKWNPEDEQSCWTLKIKEDGEVGAGMVVWSTGLMMNPFVSEALGKPQNLSSTVVEDSGVEKSTLSKQQQWHVKKDSKSGGVITDRNLRVIMQRKDGNDGERQVLKVSELFFGYKIYLMLRSQDVFALGDCANVEGTAHPATAQVASQKAEWLARSLNAGEFSDSGFLWNNMGVMAYLGDWRAIFQSDVAGDISGRAAFLLWRGAYVTRSVSVKNKVSLCIQMTSDLFVNRSRYSSHFIGC